MFAIAPADPDSPDARVLLAELGAALARITGSDGTASFDAADVRGPRACFLVARGADGSLAGCGALRSLTDDVAELKRMYARPGSGAGAALLAALERHAGVRLPRRLARNAARECACGGVLREARVSRHRQLRQVCRPA